MNKEFLILKIIPTVKNERLRLEEIIFQKEKYKRLFIFIVDFHKN